MVHVINESYLGAPHGGGASDFSCYFEYNDAVFSNSGAEEIIL
jgi:hypothetical protein